MRIIKPLLAIILMSLFLLPQVEKVWHQHSHDDISIEGVNTIHKLAEKCAICEFEFSVFDLFDLGYHFIQFSKTYFGFAESHSAFIIKSLTSFSERGPPAT
jgi:hypothetical protein